MDKMVFVKELKETLEGANNFFLNEDSTLLRDKQFYKGELVENIEVVFDKNEGILKVLEWVEEENENDIVHTIALETIAGVVNLIIRDTNGDCTFNVW